MSGGSWANGAYWAWDKSDKMLFSCLDRAAEGVAIKILKEDCSNTTLEMLRHYQGVSLLPFRDWKYSQRKVQWEEDIEKYYLLPDRDIVFSKFEWGSPKYSHFKRKHYPIFNSTHNAVSRTGHVLNLPFETTPDYLGTIIDLKSISRNGEYFCEMDPADKDLPWNVKSELKEECGVAKSGFFV